MKSLRSGVVDAKQRCSNWLQNQQKGSVYAGSEEDNQYEPDSGPYSDSHMEMTTYSADEETSNQSQMVTRSKRKFYQDETLSELSEISRDRRENPLLREITEDADIDTSMASDDMSDMSSKKPMNWKTLSYRLVCEWKNCHYITSKEESFVKHVAQHVPNLEVKCNEEDGEEVYACLWQSCSFETPNPDEVTRHVNFHSYHTKVKYIGALICQSLPECTYGGAGVNLVPDLPKPLQCLWDDCKFISNNPNVFYPHVAAHACEVPAHRGKHLKTEKRVKCLWKGCRTLVPNRKRMEEHLRSHSQERLAACPTCGVLYSSRMRLVDHIKRQATEESMTHQCTHCSRSYPSERILRDHMRHHVNHFKCQFCDMTCPTPYSLSNHIRYRHMDEKPFACTYCDYRAKSQYDIRRHMATHSAVDNFKCEEEDCNFSCRTISVLHWHYRKKHEPKAVYCCHMCDSRFARGAYLTGHLMRKHNFRWPSGHTRFRFYKNHEDGLFRLQTVRYESLDVVEDINRREGEPASMLKTSTKFKIFKEFTNNEDIAANFVVKEAAASDEDPDDPDAIDSESEDVMTRVPLNMPTLETEGQPTPKKFVISFDEVDAFGNIISSEIMEAEELLDVDEMENARAVVDGTQFENLINKNAASNQP